MTDILKTLSQASQGEVKTSPWYNFLNELDKNPKMLEHEAMERFAKTLSKASSDWKDSNDNTLLMHMAARGQLGIVKRLIHELYANPRAVNKDGESALHKGAREGYQAICEELINAGANISQQNVNKDTAATVARIAGHTEVADYLQKKETSKSIFMSANGYGQSF